MILIASSKLPKKGYGHCNPSGAQEQSQLGQGFKSKKSVSHEMTKVITCTHRHIYPLHNPSFSNIHTFPVLKCNFFPYLGILWFIATYVARSSCCRLFYGFFNSSFCHLSYKLLAKLILNLFSSARTSLSVHVKIVGDNTQQFRYYA